MKKTNLVSLISVLVLLPCMNVHGQSKAPSLDYSEPVFDKPFSYVIDTFKADGNIKDHVRLHSFSVDKNISFNIYFHKPDTKEWIFYNTGILKDVGDTETISSLSKKERIWLNHYRYFAIEQLNSKNYKYLFYKSNYDLHINVMGATMGFATNIAEAHPDRLEKTVFGMNINEFKEVWPEASRSGMGENSETYEFIYSHMITLNSLFSSVTGYDYKIYTYFYFVNNKLVKYESKQRK